MKIKQQLEMKIFWKRVPYNVYENKFPENLNDKMNHYVHLLSNALNNVPIEFVSAVIMTDYMNQKAASINLYIFGHFKKPYAAITQIASVLTPVYSEIQILPIINPVLSQEWLIEKNAQGTIYHKICEEGILAFYQDEGKK